MKRLIILLLHVGYWLCYLLIIAIMLLVFYRSSDPSVAQTARMENAFKSVFLFTFFPSFLTFYAYYFRIFPACIKPKKYGKALAYGLLFSVIAAVISYVTMRYLIETGQLIDMDNGGKNGRSTAIRVILITAFIASVSGVVALVIKGFINWFEETRVKEALQQKNLETEMALVKAQLDPHFLFNTLNNIDVLILSNPAEASVYLNKLSDILRFMLYETKTAAIELAKEIQYMEKYIELQKLRTSNANYVRFTVSGNTSGINISPMVFIPFIENAFKHTTNKKADQAITVQVTVTSDAIIFVCENKYDPLRPLTSAEGGLGNELIAKRLNLLYPGTHELRVARKPDIYCVHLTIRNG